MIEFDIPVLGRLARDESEEESARQAMVEFEIPVFGGKALHMLLIL